MSKFSVRIGSKFAVNHYFLTLTKTVASAVSPFSTRKWLTGGGCDLGFAAVAALCSYYLMMRFFAFLEELARPEAASVLSFEMVLSRRCNFKFCSS